ncbi:MAG: hypothetical protein QOI31_875 [Solirubrobacterales bacterium]|jgi:hypothetical protein|nr:hypothetical protein [Solirubrobacterales bacterium]
MPAHAGSQGPTKSLGKAKGLEYRTAMFPSVASQAGATVTCKDETFALGGGGFIDGADGLSELIGSSPADLNPDDSANAWQALGTSTTGRDEQTYAICAKEALPFEPGFTSFPGSPGIQTREVGCPSGRLVSGGIFNDDGNPVRVLESTPIDNGSDPDSAPDDGWRLVGENTGGSVSTPIIFIACSETAQLTYVSKDKNMPQGALGKSIAKCPNRYAVTGGGFEAQGVGPASGLSPWDSKDRKKVPEDGWQARVYNASIDTIEVTSTAICLKNL